MNSTHISTPPNTPQSDIITKLDPALIQLPKHPNRHECFFKSKEFYALKSSIGAARGNTVPVRVHPVAGGPGQTNRYEADYGACRIRCCLELGLEVLAIVSCTAMTDQKRLFQRVQENSCRSDFSPVDIGRIYLDAVERQLVTTQAEFANECGRDPALLSKAVKLAKLPAIILDLFDQIQDLQYRFAKPLWDAFTGPLREHFQQAAEEAAQLPRPRDPDAIVAILTGKGQPTKPAEEEPLEPFKPSLEITLRWKGQATGCVARGDDGQVDITFDRKLELQSFEKLAGALQAFLDSTGGKRIGGRAARSKGDTAGPRKRGSEPSPHEEVMTSSRQLDLDLTEMASDDRAAVDSSDTSAAQVCA